MVSLEFAPHVNAFDIYFNPTFRQNVTLNETTDVSHSMCTLLYS